MNDIAFLNSYLMEMNRYRKDRKYFIKAFAEQLAHDDKNDRYNNPHIHVYTVNCAINFAL